MKNSLIGHIGMIFQALRIESGFDVYDCQHDDLPEWMSQLSHSQQYIICSTAAEYTDKLKDFIGKTISQCGEYIYWYDGDPIEKILPKSPNAIIPNDPIVKNYKSEESLHTCTRLPSWLDDFIFKTLNAVYSPNHERFDHNLDLTENDILKYLGTYFPRSYCEAFCIFDNLFKNHQFKTTFVKSAAINIAVIGCGTGGDLMGLLTTIEKYSEEKRDLNIVVVDGNTEAIDILEKIIERYRIISRTNIRLTRIEHIFTNLQSFDITRVGDEGSFDVVMSSKMICEIISSGNGLNDNAYYDYIRKFLPLLSNTGIFYLLDVTTRQKHSTFNPFLMNEQVQKAMKEFPGYRVISPLPCCIFNATCTLHCFYQKTFTISHSHVKNDKSKVAYKLIASAQLAQNIGIPQEGLNRYAIHNDNLCPNTELWNGVIQDAFYIPEGDAILGEPIKEYIEQGETIISSKTLEPELAPTNGDNITTIPTSESCEMIGISDEDDNTEYYTGCYVIDTNVFLDKPDIIQAIDSAYFVVLSAKVLDELDHLKVKKNMSPARKKRVTKALKNISESLSDEEKEIVMEDSDTRLLPKDFDRTCPDNKILSVALKFMDENPILLTSDYGLQARAKGLGIKSISLKDFTKTLTDIH